MFDRYLKQAIQGESLNRSEAYEAAKMLLHDSIPPVKAAAFLGAMRTRKEKASELQGFVEALYEEAVRMTFDDMLIDTCGTGGDGMGTFNISTAAALVVAGCGIRVAKHGNAGVTSPVGSADVLEALGINTRMQPEQARSVLDEAGITFLFAPFYHPVLKEMGPLRREMGVPTIFNFLGPLLNPYPLAYQVIGISDPSLQDAVAETLDGLGRQRAMVVHASNGMDEISPVCNTRVSAIEAGKRHNYEIEPTSLGVCGFGLDAIKGGDRDYNASIIISILDGHPGPHRDTVLLNAAVAIMAAGKAHNMSDAMGLAAESIDSGSARQKLDKMINCSREGVH